MWQSRAALVRAFRLGGRWPTQRLLRRFGTARNRCFPRNSTFFATNWRIGVPERRPVGGAPATGCLLGRGVVFPKVT